ncbi:hypothetical protein AB0O91_33410 [Kitasatospora sp. NPDC089797]|uniref:hypothetical protein n=1 Tax=Kitasatospora sp. NPDC089797 TaxID=3155298 RepID=UPI0034180E71
MNVLELARSRPTGAPRRAFFDFFAQPAPELEQQAADALGPEALDGPTLAAAREYGLLLQSYERLFWTTLGG